MKSKLFYLLLLSLSFFNCKSQEETILKKSQFFILQVNLKNDPVLIKKYINYHKKVWPEVEDAFKKAGITGLKIYLVDNKTFLIAETDTNFNPVTGFDKITGPKIEAWDKLMAEMQDMKGDEKWKPATLIYDMK